MTTHSATDETLIAPRRIVLLVSGERAEMMREAQRLLPFVAQHADTELLDLRASQDLSGVEFDLAFVLGGDGSILRAAQQMGRRQRPVLGVNLGKVGFLADVSPDEFVRELPNICSGRLPIIEHLMLDCRLQRGGASISERIGLNEVAILGGPPFAILDVDVYVDAELVTTYSCDGLILSTPVGSTAHSLSAGGPILRQDLQAFLISPISPHTLTNRPVVDAADRVYEFVVPRPHAGTSLVVDGIVVASLEPRDRIHVQRAAATFRLLAVPGHSYYRTLREKLGWGGRLHSNHGS